MVRYLIRRAFSGLIALFIFQTFIFFTILLIFPGDYASQFALEFDNAQMEAFRREYGLDLPLIQQYFFWLRSILTGRPPLYREVLLGMIRSALPATVLVYGAGTALAFLLGSWLGRVATWRKPGLLADSVTFGAVFLYASFPPFIVMVLNLIFTGFPNRLSSPMDPNALFWRNSPVPPQQVIVYLCAILLAGGLLAALTNAGLRRRRKRIPTPAGLLLVGAGLFGIPYALGFGPHAVYVLREAGLALLAYTLLAAGEIVVVMRASMADTRHEQYVYTARAKGLPEHAVRDRHAARTALLPVVSKLVISVPYLMGGIVMVETATRWTGLGSALFGAVVGQNMPAAMAAFLVIGLFSLLASLALEVLQATLDPRIRSAGHAYA